MKKFFLYSLLFLWLISAAVVGVGYFKAKEFLRTAPVAEELAETVTIDIKPGSTFNQVTKMLHDKNIITDEFSFKMLAKYLDSDKSLQAGRFEFSTAWLPQEVLDHLVLGDPVYNRLTIPEGLTWWEVGRLLEKEGYAKYDDFKEIIHDPDFLAFWGIPFKNAEGFLYPDTYFLPKPNEITKESAKSVAGRLIDTFWRKTDSLWKEIEPDKKKPSKDTLNRYLTLASIIEKETAVPDERFRVAGVYTNRLNINMLLQADPTVAYGMGEEFKPPLLTRHLKDEKNTYNTYKIGGLPPGPICSPSFYSIEAAFNPEEHTYYYFVAKGDAKGHYFAKTLKEHNNNVRKYRKTQK